MEWVASTLRLTSEHGVSSITTADAHTSAASSRLNWRPCQFRLVRFADRRNLVSAHVPSHFKRSLQPYSCQLTRSCLTLTMALGGGESDRWVLRLVTYIFKLSILLAPNYDTS